jgi:phosphoserine phosphatase
VYAAPRGPAPVVALGSLGRVDGQRTILARVTGRDRPGITAALLDALARAGAEVYDLEQVTTRDRLVLDLLFGIAEDDAAGEAVLKDLLFIGWERGLSVDFEVIAPTPRPQPAPRYAVTVIGLPLTARALAAVAAGIAEAGANIDRITRLSRYPVVSYELVVGGGDGGALHTGLMRTASDHGIDIAVQHEGLERRAKRLIVMDVDSTLVQNEVIDLLAEEAGRLTEVRSLTDAAMAGDADFEDALRERVRLLAGLDAEAIARARDRIELAPGARTFVRTLKRLGFKVAIVSGGFSVFTDALAEELGIDHAYANELEVESGRLTGRIDGHVVDRVRKAEILREVAALESVPLEQTVAIGDGANDLDMLGAAGLGIAFNARPVLRDVADTTLSVPYLDAVLFVLGIRRADVEAADAADPSTPFTADPVPVPGTPPI